MSPTFFSKKPNKLMRGGHLGELGIIISTILRHALCLTALTLTAQMELNEPASEDLDSQSDLCCCTLTFT